MLTIIFPYRNRDLARLKHSFESLKNQNERRFEVYFVNYGSEMELSREVEKLCKEYEFINYSYHYTQFQPWNKSRALNSVIKHILTDFCFVADVDIIFHPDFVKKAIQLQQPKKTVYFQVGFLNPGEKVECKKFNQFRNFSKSTFEATGLSMFPVKELKKLRGFDEFYHFWGAEDTDMHVRLGNAGYEVEYYEEEVLILHQWHPSYRSKETKKLTEDLQIKGIVQLNHQHLKFATKNKTTTVNLNGWGKVMNEEELIEFEITPVEYTIQTEKLQIDDLLYGQLPVIKNKNLKVNIEVDPFHNSARYVAKKLLKKKVPIYKSLKEVNDQILLHLISFYRNKTYNYKVDTKLKTITLFIKL